MKEHAKHAHAHWSMRNNCCMKSIRKWDYLHDHKEEQNDNITEQSIHEWAPSDHKRDKILTVEQYNHSEM